MPPVVIPFCYKAQGLSKPNVHIGQTSKIYDLDGGRGLQEGNEKYGLREILNGIDPTMSTDLVSSQVLS